MILTIDIGNTNITFGVYENDKILFVSRLATERNRTPDQYAIEFLNILSLNKIGKTDIEGSIISSVVPELTGTLSSSVHTICGKKPLIIAPGIKTGLAIMIDDPAQLGADLAAGAVGAAEQYPLPAFVIDLGTATKIYAVNENKGFLGGMISPGVVISLKSLTDTSALLPTIALNPPTKVCAKNTVECMQSGVILGTAAMIDGMLERMSDELGSPKTIVATGGLAPFIINECSHDIKFDDNLVLQGLYEIYKKNTK